MNAAILTANPGREGRTKLVIELIEFGSLGAVVVMGVLADRSGLAPAMAGYAVVPLGLIVVAVGLSTRRR